MLYIIPTDTCYGIWCPFYDKEAYERIYKLKKRSFDKPLAILVESFNWLEKNTELTSKQVEFLRNYHRPFTILTESTPSRVYLEFHTDEEEAFINKDIYTHISFRVAHNDIQKKLLKETWPLWLTSANLADAWETYGPEKIQEDFGYQISTWELVFHSDWELDNSNPPSDVFSFIWESLEVEYTRRA